MKESVNVAKTLAWKLTNKQKQKSVHKEFKEQGIHIHCPEGSIQKTVHLGTVLLLFIVY